MGKRKKTRRSGICPICGRDQLLTRDHLPPKGLFGKPLPGDLLTVATCSDCNGSSTKDDEYFRTVLTLRNDVLAHPKGKEAFASVKRAFQKPEKHAFRNMILKNIVPVGVHSKDDDFLGTALAYDVDADRLRRVVTKLIRGLFYHETNTVLPQSAQIVALWEGEVLQFSEDTKNMWIQMYTSAFDQPPKVIGDGTFAYQFLLFNEDSNASVWSFAFYESVYFLGISKSA